MPPKKAPQPKKSTPAQAKRPASHAQPAAQGSENSKKEQVKIDLRALAEARAQRNKQSSNDQASISSVPSLSENSSVLEDSRPTGGAPLPVSDAESVVQGSQNDVQKLKVANELLKDLAMARRANQKPLETSNNLAPGKDKDPKSSSLPFIKTDRRVGQPFFSPQPAQPIQKEEDRGQPAQPKTDESTQEQTLGQNAAAQEETDQPKPLDKPSSGVGNGANVYDWYDYAESDAEFNGSEENGVPKALPQSEARLLDDPEQEPYAYAAQSIMLTFDELMALPPEKIAGLTLKQMEHLTDEQRETLLKRMEEVLSALAAAQSQLPKNPEEIARQQSILSAIEDENPRKAKAKAKNQTQHQATTVSGHHELGLSDSSTEENTELDPDLQHVLAESLRSYQNNQATAQTQSTEADSLQGTTVTLPLPEPQKATRDDRQGSKGSDFEEDSHSNSGDSKKDDKPEEGPFEGVNEPSQSPRSNQSADHQQSNQENEEQHLGNSSSQQASLDPKSVLNSSSSHRPVWIGGVLFGVLGGGTAYLLEYSMLYILCGMLMGGIVGMVLGLFSERFYAPTV